jgi:hypothetical protein
MQSNHYWMIAYMNGDSILTQRKICIKSLTQQLNNFQIEMLKR